MFTKSFCLMDGQKVSGDVDMGNETEEIEDLYSLGIDPRKKSELNDKKRAGRACRHHQAVNVP